MKTTIIIIASLLFGLLTNATNHSNNDDFKIQNTAIFTQNSIPTAEIVDSYLSLKNALVKGDTKAAAMAGEKLLLSFTTTALTELNTTQRQVFDKVSKDIQKQTKEIISNNGKLDKQRKSFQIISKNMEELIATFGTTKKIYKDFCPMFEGGSIWFSETKEIRNPYYGNQMLTCGKIKEVIE